MLINLIFFSVLPVLFGNTLHIDKQEKKEDKKISLQVVVKKRQDDSSGNGVRAIAFETHCYLLD